MEPPYPIAVTLPNGTINVSTATGNLPKLALPEKAREVHIFREFDKGTLISGGKLCNAGCTLTFTAKDVVVYNELGQRIILGWRDPVTKLWCIPIAQSNDWIPPTSSDGEELVANVYEIPSFKEAIQYLHAAAGFPVKSTWIKAVKNGNYSTWPLITPENVSKYCPIADETSKGHMHQQRQGTRSTKPRQAATPMVKTYRDAL